MSEQQVDDKQSKFEQALVSKIATEAITEQRRARRWSVFFKLFLLAYVSVFTLMFFVDGWDGP